MGSMRILVAAWAMWLGALPGAPSQETRTDLEAKIDAVIAAAYAKAAAGFPCRIKAGGKPRMMRWQEVDRCLNDAAARVEWEAVSGSLRELRAAAGVTAGGRFEALVREALETRALAYDRIFEVKNADALLPLTHSVLKYLPDESLLDLPVFDRRGTAMGTFAGVFPYERTGGLASANTYRLMLFQYKDRNGNIQSPPDKLLLDSFGVPWKDAAHQKGFRLPIERFELAGP